jgi:glutathione S-transferase
MSKKYGFGRETRVRNEETLTAGLGELRAALKGKRYLLGQFSYADIAMAMCVQFIKPVDSPVVPLGSALRAAWTDAARAVEFADLLRWRDALYEDHRARPVLVSGDALTAVSQST